MGAGPDSAGRRGPSGGGWLSHTRPPTPDPTWALPLVPEELQNALERPLRARCFCPGSPETRGARFRDNLPAPTADLPCPTKQAGHAGRREEGRGAPGPLSPRWPASRRAPQWRGQASRVVGTRAPGPAPSCREPRLAAASAARAWGWGPGGAGPGRRRVSGCSGNGDVPGVGGASTQVAYFRK